MKNIDILPDSNKPIYQQLFDQISTQIIMKELKEETQLPSIRVAALELNVSIITIKKTWELLELNKFIYTVPGKGAFVAKHSDAFLKDKKNQLAEELLEKVIDTCKNVGITKEELIDLIKILY